MIYKKYLGLFVIIFTIIISTTGITNVDASPVVDNGNPCFTAHVPLLKWLCPSPPPIPDPPTTAQLEEQWYNDNCKKMIDGSGWYDCDGTNPWVDDP